MERTQLEFPSEHAIRAWAVKHSVFLLNRFHFHHTLRSTPFFALNGYNYTGKLLCFGEVAVEEAGKERRGTLDQRCLAGKEQPGCQYFGNKGWNLYNVLSEEKREKWEKELIFALDNTPWSAKPARGKPTKIKPNAPGMTEDVGQERMRLQVTQTPWKAIVPVKANRTDQGIRMKEMERKIRARWTCWLIVMKNPCNLVNQE